ncbi:MAG: prepilin peptidase [Deltaproteobacteria bacterium]|nr:prepilin peptidase [Deltaproteobacteria bacterium]
MGLEFLSVLIALVTGLIFGSFFNVCIYRIPRQMSVVSPPSHCPVCGHRLPFWLNIPLLTYLFLRGRCYFCRQPVALRYPLVEALTGLLFGAAVCRFGLSPALIGALLLISLLIPITFIDLEHQIIPDRFSLTGIVLGLAGAWWWGPMPWWESGLGAFLGWFSLWLVASVYYYATGREGMGGGDLKLLAMLGAFLGYKALLPIILLSSLSGAVIGLGLIFWQGKDGRFAIAFGPFLAAGGLLYLFYGPQLIALYWRLLLPS